LPKISLVIFGFIEIDNLGLSIFLSIFENSRFVTGFGDTTFTGP